MPQRFACANYYHTNPLAAERYADLVQSVLIEMDRGTLLDLQETARPNAPFFDQVTIALDPIYDDGRVSDIRSGLRKQFLARESAERMRVLLRVN